MATRICPHCGAQGAFALGTEQRPFDPLAESFIHFEICRNPACGGAIAVVTSGTPASECASYPEVQEDVTDLLPDGVRAAFQQARMSFRAGIYDGAALMCLRSLEEATLALGAKGKTLDDRIASLTRGDGAPAMLREWAQSPGLGALLKSGKIGNGAEQAVELTEFCERFFEYAFALPARVHESRRKLKDGGRQILSPRASNTRLSSLPN